LDAFAEAVKRDLNFVGPASVRAYLSPNGQGFDMHFDARIATTLQIEGRKRWMFSKEVALTWPHYQVRSVAGSLRADRPLQDWEKYRPPEDCSFEEVLLEPGDLLCLPAGCWHRAEADGSSLALNLAFGAPGGFWAILSPVLTSLLVMNKGWREPPPPVLASRTGHRDIPKNLMEFFDERIDELIEMLQSIRGDPEALREAWFRFLGNRPPS
jgi:ribosomal protein L16 Arg81 hydroxylase